MELQRAPLVRLIIPFVVGIIAGGFINVSYPAALLLTVPFFIAGLLFVLAKSRWQTRLSLSVWPGIIINAAFIVFGIAALKATDDTAAPSHLIHRPAPERLLVRLLENPEEKNKTWKITADAEWILNQPKPEKTSGKLILYINKQGYNSPLQYGDYIVVSGNLQEITPPLNPGEFDYKKWLSYQNIYHSVFLKADQYYKTGEHSANPVYSFAYRCRQYFSGILKKHLPDSATFGVANALIIGQRDYLDEEITETYSQTGTIHVLAVSGLHVGVLYLLVNYLLFFLNRNTIQKILKVALVLVILWLYAIVTGLSPSVTRAAIMFSFLKLGEAGGRKIGLYNSLAASALFILLLDAKALYNIGFQLSYLALLGIGFIQPGLYRLFIIKNKVADFTWKLTTASIAAQIATFPLGIYYFHQFPTYFLISNLLIVPLGSLALYMGILLLAASPLPWLAGWIGKGLHYILYSCNYITDGISNWPLAYSSNLYLSLAGTVLVCAAIVFAVIYFQSKKYTALIISLSSCVILSLLSVYRNYSTFQDSVFTIYALNNKESAISYIHHNKAILISGNELTSSKAFKQKIQPHFILANVSEYQAVKENYSAPGFDFYPNGSIAVHNQKILWLNNLTETEELKNTKWDIIIIDNNPKIKIKQLTTILKFNKIVFTTNNWPSRVAEWEKESAELNIPFHNIAEKGAFQLKFNPHD